MWLVRHARAGDRARWEGRDEGRPLSASGTRQAEGLLTTLEPHGVRTATAVLSSDYLRCRQTVEPLAAALGMAVEDCVALCEGMPAAAVLELVASCGSAVLCSHGDVIGELVLMLAGRGVLRDAASWEKGSTWVVEAAGGDPVSARYVPPPS